VTRKLAIEPCDDLDGAVVDEGQAPRLPVLWMQLVSLFPRPMLSSLVVMVVYMVRNYMARYMLLIRTVMSANVSKSASRVAKQDFDVQSAHQNEC
jgi:hypothetical protein